MTTLELPSSFDGLLKYFTSAAVPGVSSARAAPLPTITPPVKPLRFPERLKRDVAGRDFYEAN